MASPKESIKSCSHNGYMEGEARNSGFTRLHLALVGPIWGYMRDVLRSFTCEAVCQTVYQNGSSSTDGAIHGTKASQKRLH